MLVDRLWHQRQQPLHGIRHVGTLKQVADVGAAVLLAQVHDLGPIYVDAALPCHVHLDGGVGYVLVLLGSRRFDLDEAETLLGSLEHVDGDKHIVR